MIKVGLVGYGGMGHVHADSIHRINEAVLTCVCDIDVEKLKSPHEGINIDIEKKSDIFDISNTNTYTNFKEMLAKEEIDFLIVTLPTDLHCEYSVMALESGCHVFCEKPMALCSADCLKMIKASERTGKKIMIGQCIRFWSEYEFLEECIKNKTYGDLRSLTMERVGTYPAWSTWFMNGKRSGGAIIDLHVHDVDWARYALGEPDKIFGAGTVGMSGRIDDSTLIMQYKNCSVNIRGSWMLTQDFRMTYEAIFDRATISFDPKNEPTVKIYTTESSEPEYISLSKKSAYLKEMEYFIECIKDGKTNNKCTPSSSMEGIKVAETEIKSIME